MKEQQVVVGGVDTHKDLHVAAVVDSQDRVLGSECFPSTRHGYKQMLIWMRSFGELARVGVECTGTYGAGLLRYLQQAGITVLEVTAQDRSDRRRRGKDDTIDAENAAHAAFAGVRTVTPKTRDGMIEALRVLKVCRKTAIAARRVALQLIHNTIVSAPDELRESLRTMTRMQLIRTLAAWRPDLTDYRNLTSAYRITLKSLARRYLELHDEIADLDVMIAGLVDELAPGLIARNSIGYESAAQLLLTAGDNSRLVRRQPRAGLLGQGYPASAEPRRRSRREQRFAHHRHWAAENRPSHQGLHGEAGQRGALQAGGHPLSQALHRARSFLPHTAPKSRDRQQANCRLTLRRASGVLSTSAFATANGWPKRASSHLSAAGATATIMRWLKRSTACTRLN
jgi:transposase